MSQLPKALHIPLDSQADMSSTRRSTYSPNNQLTRVGGRNTNVGGNPECSTISRRARATQTATGGRLDGGCDRSGRVCGMCTGCYQGLVRFSWYLTCIQQIMTALSVMGLLVQVEERNRSLEDELNMAQATKESLCDCISTLETQHWDAGDHARYAHSSLHIAF